MKINHLSVALIFASLLTLSFYKQSIGLNLILFESIYFTWLFFQKSITLNTINQKVIILSTLISLLSTFFIHSHFAFTIHFLLLFMTMGLCAYPQSQLLTNTITSGFDSAINSFQLFLSGVNSRQRNKFNLFKYLKFILPLLLVFLFIIIYRLANPLFDNIIIKAGNWIDHFLHQIFSLINFSFWCTFLICLIMSIILVYTRANDAIISSDKKHNPNLIRIKTHLKNYASIMGLSNFNKKGIFTLLLLNIVLLILNITEIKWVWIGFKWKGEYLKEFVHNGTYLLIVSIVLSIWIVLYYFHRNLNFYSKVRWLKYLSYIWLIQNIILCISVCVRNGWYIHYFSLAYKRIGVFLFIILTLFGILTTLYKLAYRKSFKLLIQQNMLFGICIMTIFSIFNWDKIIARYNFAHANKSFLHLEFMVELSDNALPYLIQEESKLQTIDKMQNDKFAFRQEFITIAQYQQLIEEKKNKFIKRWQSKLWLSWNWAEYSTYKELQNQP